MQNDYHIRIIIIKWASKDVAKKCLCSQQNTKKNIVYGFTYFIFLYQNTRTHSIRAQTLNTHFLYIYREFCEFGCPSRAFEYMKKKIVYRSHPDKSQHSTAGGAERKPYFY